MADTMQFDLVSPERSLVSIPAREVRLPGNDGDLTAMPGHASTIVTLRPGMVTVIDGQGTAVYANGMIYEGGFKAGQNAGQGRMTYPDGYVYDGNWQSGERQGKGTATYPDGSVYEGDFAAGLRDGTGKLTTPDGFTYEGAWTAGQIDGPGIATYANGDVYEGNFVSGKRQGQGAMRYATGQIAEGKWTDNALSEPVAQPEAAPAPDIDADLPEPDAPASPLAPAEDAIQSLQQVLTPEE